MSIWVPVCLALAALLYSGYLRSTPEYKRERDNLVREVENLRSEVLKPLGPIVEWLNDRLTRRRL